MYSLRFTTRPEGRTVIFITHRPINIYNLVEILKQIFYQPIYRQYTQHVVIKKCSIRLRRKITSINNNFFILLIRHEKFSNCTITGLSFTSFPLFNQRRNKKL